MKRSSQPRLAAELSKALNHQLNSYTLAAGAAGVGLLALAQPAEAKIIYTPAHANVGIPLPVGLNHDGIVDFYFVTFRGRLGTNGSRQLSACQYWGSGTANDFCLTSGTNAVRTIDSNGAEYAAALRFGDKVQRGPFAKGRAILGKVIIGTGLNTTWRGPWFRGGKGVKHRYLGLKFKIKGRFHFGWARLTVKTTQRDFTATLTGYAYETIPGKGIIAGKTKGPDVITLPVDTEAGTLGHLALGRK